MVPLTNPQDEPNDVSEIIEHKSDENIQDDNNLTMKHKFRFS